MDRFIGKTTFEIPISFVGLKSNMDRFIDSDQLQQQQNCSGLKSNMDRFIVNICLNS